jgi:hypothetical protein
MAENNNEKKTIKATGKPKWVKLGPFFCLKMAFFRSSKNKNSKTLHELANVEASQR